MVEKTAPQEVLRQNLRHLYGPHTPAHALTSRQLELLQGTQVEVDAEAIVETRAELGEVIVVTTAVETVNIETAPAPPIS